MRIIRFDENDWPFKFCAQTKKGKWVRRVAIACVKRTIKYSWIHYDSVGEGIDQSKQSEVSEGNGYRKLSEVNRKSDFFVDIHVQHQSLSPDFSGMSCVQ